MATEKPDVWREVMWRCLSCGAVGKRGESTVCRCWVVCGCGWRHLKGKPCANPAHAEAKGRR